MMFRASGLLAPPAATLALWLAVAPLFAQDCSLSAEGDGAIPLAYGPRGDRCEGLYRNRVANRINLRVVGYHLDRPPEALGATEAIDLAVGGGDLAEIAGIEPQFRPELRVMSLREQVYYQMDTRSLSPDGRFLWSLDVFRPLADRLPPRDLGAVVCAPGCEDQKAGVVVAPVVFLLDGQGGDRQAQVYLMADVELQSLHVDMRVGDRILLGEHRIGGRFLPAMRAHRLQLPQWESGAAELVFLAVTRSGQRDVLRLTLAPPIAPSR